MSNTDWCSDKVQPGFLLSERASGHFFIQAKLHPNLCNQNHSMVMCQIIFYQSKYVFKKFKTIRILKFYAIQAHMPVNPILQGYKEKILIDGSTVFGY